MKVTNYLRDAILKIQPLIHKYKNEDADYGQFVETVIEGSKEAVKFILPVNGKIFDTNYKGLPEEAKLPYEKIVIEYENNDEYGLTDKILAKENLTPARKRIVYAEQRDEKILVVAITGFQIYAQDVWEVQPFLADIRPSKSIDKNEIIYDFKEYGDGTIDSVCIGIHDIGKKTEERFGEKWLEYAYFNLMGETNAVLGLIEALTCTNVEMETIPGKKNKLAQMKGALPFDDYRVLVLKNQVTTMGADAGGSHRSPREHLRRGHIRRLPKGNIWINSMIVNAGVGGRVIKDYAIKKQSRSA